MPPASNTFDRAQCYRPMTTDEEDRIEVIAEAIGVGDVADYLQRTVSRLFEDRNRSKRAHLSPVTTEAIPNSTCGTCTVIQASTDGRRPCEVSTPIVIFDLLYNEVAPSFVAAIDPTIRAAARAAGGSDEDAVQEARIAVVSSMKDFDPARGTAKGFARLVSRRAALRHLKKNENRRLREAAAHDGAERLRAPQRNGQDEVIDLAEEHARFESIRGTFRAVWNDDPENLIEAGLEGTSALAKSKGIPRATARRRQLRLRVLEQQLYDDLRNEGGGEV